MFPPCDGFPIVFFVDHRVGFLRSFIVTALVPPDPRLAAESKRGRLHEEHYEEHYRRRIPRGSLLCCSWASCPRRPRSISNGLRAFVRNMPRGWIAAARDNVFGDVASIYQWVMDSRMIIPIGRH